MRHCEEQDRTDGERYAHPQEPRAGFAVLGVSVLNDDAHDHIRDTVKDTDSSMTRPTVAAGDTGIVGVEQR